MRYHSLSSAFEEINWTIDSPITSLSSEPKKSPFSIILIGGIIIGLGLVFIAQSSSLLGPSSSFMYKNADWTIYGSAVTRDRDYRVFNWFVEEIC